VTEADWVVLRDGSAHDVLTKDGTWGAMEDAQWFATQEEALQAKVPEGTTGTPREQHPDAHR
jgi:hypothetical protein